MSYQLMAWASRQTTGSPTRKAVLLALANRANHDTGVCCPTVATICEETELGERAVRDALRGLCDLGLLTRTRRRRQDGSLGTYDYTFVTKPPARSATPPAADAARPPAADAGQEPGSSEPGSATTDVVASGDAEELAPKMVQVDGRNLPFDALQRSCGIQDRSPRMIEIATALNGTRRNGGEDGIRVMAWRELRDEAGMVGDGPALEHAIAALIEARAGQYRRVFGTETTLTPLALRKWWVDLPGLEERAGGGAVDAAQIAAAELRRMEGS